MLKQSEPESIAKSRSWGGTSIAPSHNLRDSWELASQQLTRPNPRLTIPNCQLVRQRMAIDSACQVVGAFTDAFTSISYAE